MITEMLVANRYGLIGETLKGDAIVVSGGGIDAFVAALLYQKIAPANAKLLVLFINYAQSNLAAERMMAKAQAAVLGASFHELVDPIAGLLANSPLNNRETVAGTVGESTNDDYVPLRNMRMLTLAASVGEALGYETLIFGAVGSVNVDNSPDFVTKAVEAFLAGSRHCFAIYAPFLMWTKAAVASVAQDITSVETLPLVTVSCFNATVVQDLPNDTEVVTQCGQCRSCVSLKQAFAFANARDPYKYEN